MNPSLLLIPDRYKAAKLYSQIPDSGAGDLTFARNSNATRVNSAGLIEKVRTNAFTHSEDFTNAVWAPANVAVTANTTTAPNGTLTADSVLSILAFGEHGIRFTTSMAASTEHTVSVFAKQITTRYAYIRDLTNNVVSVFDLQNGVVSLQAAGHVARIEAVGSFYRISITFQTPAIIINNLIDFGITVDGTNFVSTVPVGEGIALWGAQLETGVLTDYIPTTTAAVSVGITADIPRLDYTGAGCPSLLLEPQRTNLITFSEQFDNAAWINGNATITANAAVSPDGSTNADLIYPASAGDDRGVTQVIASTNTAHTISFFAKAAGKSFVYLYNAKGAARSTWFNLSNGTIGTLGAGATATITPYGNGWYRCTMTDSTIDALTLVVSINVSDANNSPATTPSGTDGVLLYGCQAEASATYPTSYIPTLGSSVTRLADVASKTGISSLIGATEGTIFLEVAVNNANTANGVFFECIGASTADTFVFFIDGSNDDLRLFNSASLVPPEFISDNYTPSTTIKIAFAYKANDYALYVNGVSKTVSATSAVPNGLANIYLNSNRSGAEVSQSTYKQAVVYNTRLSNSQLATLTAL
jgi:hypothetical protein